MNAGFNKLTQLSVGAIRDAFSDEQSGSEVFASLTEEESPYEQAQYESLEGGSSGTFAGSQFDMDVFRGGRFDTVDENPFGQNIVMLDDDSLVLQDNPLLEIGQATPVQAGSVQFFGQSYTYEEPTGFDFVQVTDDPTDIFHFDYYYVDTSEGLMYKAVRKEGNTNVFTVRKIGSALERLSDKRTLLLSRKKTLAKFPSLALEVDQKCVLGPDLGWEARFDRTFSNEVQKANRKAEKKDDWDSVLRGTTNAATWFKINVREKTLMDLDSIRNANLRDEVLAFNDTLGEVNYVLPITNSTIAQIESLLAEYDSEGTDETRKSEILKRLSAIDSGTNIPSSEEVERMIVENERIEKAYTSLRERTDECFQELKDHFTPGQRVWPDDWYLEVRVAQDQAQVLYCPFEMIGGDKLEYITISDQMISDEDMVEHMRYRGQWVTDAVGPINNRVKTFVDHGVRGVDIN